MYILQTFVRESKLSFSKRKSDIDSSRSMEASTRKVSQTPKRFDHLGAKKACENIFDPLKQKMVTCIQ